MATLPAPLLERAPLGARLRGFALALAIVLGPAGCSSCSGSPAPVEDPGAPAAASATAISPALQATLDAALRAKGSDYAPRTRHKQTDGSPKYTNRLILETSPYLVQHAHNPVSWFPWGDEAFAAAKATGRPIFLSVGYSTCHWCHVMEEESFEDEEIARYLNEHYVPIKVDREERPDVDSIYMTAVQNLTGSGGWPMSVWLTPEREPFLGGTYFPPRDGARGTRRGFLSILKEQSDRFRQNPAGAAEDARRLADQVRRTLSASPAGDLVEPGVVPRAASSAARRYDPAWGGARGAPKFPSSFPVRLLLRHHRRAGEPLSLQMAIETLRRMASGGIYDHIGGGFHRYATDSRWLVPHFEKMLYDNALLAVAYLEGWQASGDEDLARVVRETLDYVLREMTSPEGGFYSATDADSPTPSGRREEGWFFTWTPAEIEAALGPERARVIGGHYAVTPEGNFEGRAILHTPRPRDDVARELAISRARLDAVVAESAPILRGVRSKRAPPLRDDKIQTSWNGLMISALARAAPALGEPRYEAAAIRAAELLLTELRPGGELKHSWITGRASGRAFLEDYTFFAAGLLDLFELTADARWLREAIALMEALEQGHSDPTHGGYFLTAVGSDELLARDKPDSDGAVPSGNSIALMNQLRLAEITTDDRWRQRAETTARAFALALGERPLSLGEMLLAVDFLTDRPREIVLVLPAGERSGALAPAARPLAQVLARELVPNRALLVASETDLGGALGDLVPWAKGKTALKGRPTAYVCERGACQLPTSDPEILVKQLRQVHPYAPAAPAK
jgi:uncharacterized protein YyaL (SSP411 family)